MLKKLLAGAALAACAVAQAEERTFEIVYQGFHSVDFDEFQPDMKLSVEITVDDLDNNGTYSLEELKGLYASDIEYDGTCSVYNCMDYFSWTPGSLPEYSARYSYTDPFTYEMTAIVSGVHYKEFLRNNWGFLSDYTWEWTPATTTTITEIAPVPEPAQYGMLAAGLAGMGLLARRRRAGA